MIKSFLTPKGWRVVAHSLLAVAGGGILYLLSLMVLENIQHRTLSWWVLGMGITISLWLIVLGSMLAKAELTDWR